MNARTLRRVLAVFPRYSQDNGPRWPDDGIKTLCSGRVITKRQLERVRTWICRMEDAKLRPVVRMVTVTGKDLRLLHRAVYFKGLLHYARSWAWNRRRWRNLPVVVRMDGLLYVWNGTHRTTLCRLAGRKLRAKVFNVDQFRKWERANRGNRK